MSLSMEAGMAYSPSPGNEALRMEGNMGFRDSAVLPFQRFHCALVLKYFWLKEEMTKSTATFVADGLYAAQNGQNGLISDPHYERINECRRRRQQVDILLQYILRSTKETYTCFLQLLMDSGDEHIATSLDENGPTDAQFQEFVQLQLSSLGNSPRPDFHCPRFMLQEGVLQRLRYMLNDVATTDVIADFLLSKLFFSISEHKNISSCPLRDEQRVGSLLHTVTKCSYKIREALAEVLDILKMEHVRSYLYQIGEMLEDNVLPNRLLDNQTERSILKAFQADPMELNMKTFKEFSFEVEEMEVGSILIRLRPVCKDSWQRFQEQCSSGEIKNFIASVYENENLEEGRYEIDVKIYKELTGHCAIIHLKEKHETETKEAGTLVRKKNYIVRHMDLLCEEMDVSTSLLSYLSQHELINDLVKEELKRKNGRAEKIRFLLTGLSMKEHAEERLKQFIQETDRNLFDDIESIENETNLVKEEETVDDPRYTRYKIVCKLLADERAYVARLHLLDVAFHMQVTSENMEYNFMPTELVTRIFLYIHSIYQLHHDAVLPQLETSLENWTQKEGIGFIFLRITPLLELYRGFVKNFSNVIDLITEWTNKSPEFASALQKIQEPTEYGQLTLQQRLFEMKRRVSVYELHLKEYLKCLGTESAEIAMINNALAFLKEAEDYIDYPLKKTEDSPLKVSKSAKHFSKESPGLSKDRPSTIVAAPLTIQRPPRLPVSPLEKPVMRPRTQRQPSSDNRLTRYLNSPEELPVSADDNDILMHRRVSFSWMSDLDIQLALYEYISDSAENLPNAVTVPSISVLSPLTVKDVKRIKGLDPRTAEHPPRRLYFTAVAILIFKKKDFSCGKTVKENSSTKSDMQVWCPKLIDPVCYFEEKTNTKDDFPDMMKPRPKSEERIIPNRGRLIDYSS